MKRVFALLAVLILSPLTHAAIPVVEMEVPVSPSYFTGSEWPEGFVALTFDDGPNPKVTPKVLDILEKYGVRGTFFLVGQMAERQTRLVQELAARGHTIGTHTYNHPSLGGATSGASAMANIQRGFAAVEKALGEVPAMLFRFPYLASNSATRNAVAQAGIAHIGWNEISLTTNLAPVNGHLKRGVLITHDTKESCPSVLPRFLDQMERYGYTAVVLIPQKK